MIMCGKMIKTEKIYAIQLLRYFKFFPIQFIDDRVVELPPVEIRENDVCVKMIAAPINPSDINQIEGLHDFFFNFTRKC